MLVQKSYVRFVSEAAFFAYRFSVDRTLKKSQLARSWPFHLSNSFLRVHFCPCWRLWRVTFPICIILHLYSMDFNMLQDGCKCKYIFSDWIFQSCCWVELVVSGWCEQSLFMMMGMLSAAKIFILVRIIIFHVGLTDYWRLSHTKSDIARKSTT